MKIACIVGARPQFIKLAPLSREIRKKHKEVIIHTGQHYDQELSEIFFKELKIPEPGYNLEVGSGEQGRQSGEMLIRIEEVLQFEKPDWAIVFGDTNSTLAGALAAAKLHILLAHVEAGMRSYNNSMPEEINRKVTDHLSQLLFCPSKNAVNNLRKEGLNKGVYLVGDLMQEALAENIKVAGRKSKILKRLRLPPKGFYLVTIHRAENTDSRTRLEELASLLSKLDRKTIFPIHPRTKKCLQEYGLWSKLSRFKNLVMLEPVGYLDMLVLEQSARMVLTDSGGVQREAYFLGTPCVILRNETEWSEMIGKSLKLANDLSKLPRLDFVAKPNTQTAPKFKTSRKIVSLLSRESLSRKR